MSDRMFKFITCTWNPLGGACPYECKYCWARKLAKDRKMQKYLGKPRLIETELKRKFKPDDFVFVQDMSDLFAEGVDWSDRYAVFNHVGRFPQTKFLLLTKNPDAYLGIIGGQNNCVLGATIETNRHYGDITLAPTTLERLEAMEGLCMRYDIPRFVSIEPIMDFDLDEFVGKLTVIAPWGIAVGYDNYNNCLLEPPLAKTLKLIEELEKFTTVYRKSLRKAWNEKM